MMIEIDPSPPRSVDRAARHARPRAILLALLLLAACHSEARRRPRPVIGPPRITGAMVGEVTAHGAVIWGRCDQLVDLRVLVNAERGMRVDPNQDLTARVVFENLAPNTRYDYRAWCRRARANLTGADDALTGSFRTAPDPAVPRAVHFAWSGDVGGQNVCRDRSRGYPIFADLAARKLDFFVALGDMIYADDACLERGRYGNAQIAGPPPAIDLKDYWAHWRYNRADVELQRMLASTSTYAVWDDHEIRNDSGPHDDESPLAPGTHLLPTALHAFLDYQPIVAPEDDPRRLYRSVRWGKHVELFLLDTRQYRDALAAPDSEAKTMLGAAQLAWLEQALAHSDATWKIIVSSVPLSIPTGTAARDGFASGDTDGGYEREAARIFALLRAHGVRNHLWITTDLHFATGFRLHPFADDPAWLSYEFASGPLNAGVLPVQSVDPTFRPERLFFYGPASADAISSFKDAVGWFNFGTIDVDADGALTVGIVNGLGKTVAAQRLTPVE